MATIDLARRPGLIQGTPDDDLIKFFNFLGAVPAVTINQNRFIRAGAGDDTVETAGGNDFIFLQEGHDTARSGAGDDRVDGGDGDDKIYGGAGSDALNGDDGDDYIEGGDGDDAISGGRGSNGLIGGSGDDTIFGGPGTDAILPGPGSDIVRPGVGGNSILVFHEGFDQQEEHSDTLKLVASDLAKGNIQFTVTHFKTGHDKIDLTSFTDASVRIVRQLDNIYDETIIVRDESDDVDHDNAIVFELYNVAADDDEYVSRSDFIVDDNATITFTGFYEPPTDEDDDQDADTDGDSSSN